MCLFASAEFSINAAPEANNRLVDRAYTAKWLLSAKSSPKEDAAFAKQLKAWRAQNNTCGDGLAYTQWSRSRACEISPAVKR